MRPGLVLTDSNLPICDGPETARRIKGRMPEVLVVILGTPEDDQELVRAIQSGVDGYLLKDILPEELFRHLRAIQKGITPLSPALAAPLFRQLGRLSSAARSTSPGAALSPREADVVKLISEGQSNREIAAQLAIAENTVKNHVRSILRKLGALNRAQAAAIAVASGVIGLPTHDGPTPAAGVE
jgi:two-component system NarL family response regulator